MVNPTISEIELNLVEKGQLVESLWHSVDHTAGNLEIIPGLVKRVIETGAWRDRVYRGKSFHHDHFIDFITTKPLAGCGWPPEKVEVLIKDDSETLRLWRKATTAPAHVHQTDSDNITIKPKRGTDKAYTLERLERERPDLYKRVLAKELSANAAAIEAGWRKEKTALERLRIDWRKASAEERQTFLAEIHS